jgi:hypothetical protein
VTTRRASTVLACLLAFASGACVFWDPWVPDQPLPDPTEVRPSRAVLLHPPASHAGQLDCKAGSCEQWFRVEVDRPGRLQLAVGVQGLGPGAIARVFLQDAGGATLGAARSGDGLPLRVEGDVEPGPYAVLVQIGGGLVLYQLEAALEP